MTLDSRRIGLISDIHGNSVALEAVLHALAANGVEELICLGDVAIFGPDPQGVIARLRTLNCPVVMGNTDAWALDPQPHAYRNADTPIYNAIEGWGAALLTAYERSYLQTFAPTLKLDLGGGMTVVACHGSPTSFHQGIFATTPDADLADWLADTSAHVIACGHTHVQMLRRYEQTLLINPGSVGQPLATLSQSRSQAGGRQVAYGPWAEFALLEAPVAPVAPVEAQWRVQFYRIPIAVSAIVDLILASDMPHKEWYSAQWQGVNSEPPESPKSI